MIDARAEHVGSLLRPPGLLAARDAHAAGRLDDAGLKAAEDAAVREVVAMQERAGMDVVNDGELRRESFQAELTRAQQLGLDAIVTHPGNATDGDHARGRAQNAALIELSLEAARLAREIGQVTYSAVRRTENELADSLVNEALDAAEERLS